MPCAASVQPGGALTHHLSLYNKKVKSAGAVGTTTLNTRSAPRPHVELVRFHVSTSAAPYLHRRLSTSLETTSARRQTPHTSRQASCRRYRRPSPRRPRPAQRHPHSSVTLCRLRPQNFKSLPLGSFLGKLFYFFGIYLESATVEKYDIPVR
jgi:hypothetical protein